MTKNNWKAVEVNDSWGIESDITIGGNKGRGIIISGLIKEYADKIAAVDDLLEALKSFFEDNGVQERARSYEKARAAIAKAEGK